MSRSKPSSHKVKKIDEDVEMTDVQDEPTFETEPELEPEPVSKRKTKPKAKKVVPVGSNGLKKKRMIKSRQTIDAKGYFGV